MRVRGQHQSRCSGSQIDCQTLSIVRDCANCRERIEPEEEAVCVSRQEPTDMPGVLEPVTVERRGFVHEECELEARHSGWRRPGALGV